MSKYALAALRYPKDVVADVSRLVELHLRFHGYGTGEWTDSAVRRYVRDAGHLLPRLHKLTRADCTTRNKRKAARRWPGPTTTSRSGSPGWSEEEELGKIRPELDGNEIQEVLGLPPGPVVGKAYKFLLELRLDRGPIGKEAAAEALREWAREQTGIRTCPRPSSPTFDREHVWHPYAPMPATTPVHPVVSADGRTADARRRPRAGRRHVVLVGGDPRLPPPRCSTRP